MTTAAQTGSALTFRELAAAEVRAHMARRSMSGRMLAKILQKDQTWVSRRLNSLIPMTTDDLDLIAAALGMSPMDLLAGVAPTHQAPQPNPPGPLASQGYRRKLGVTRHLRSVADATVSAVHSAATVVGTEAA